MCIAALIESIHDLPPADVRAMARQNPDGGGLAWVDGESVVYRRGLNSEDMIKLIPHLPRPFFLHFRIATRGKAIPELTHPFPVGFAAISDAHELTGMARAVVMHNGTWQRYKSYVPPYIDAEAVSDTQIAAYVAGWDESILDEVTWSNAIMRAAGEGRASVTLRGNWEPYKDGGKEHRGNLYSNLHWCRPSWGWESWRAKRGNYAGNVTRAASEYYAKGDDIWIPEDTKDAPEDDASKTQKFRAIPGIDAPTPASVYARASNANEGVETTRSPKAIARGLEKRAKLARKEMKRARRAARQAAKRAAMADPDRALDLVDLMERAEARDHAPEEIETAEDIEAAIVAAIEADAHVAPMASEASAGYLDSDFDAAQSALRGLPGMGARIRRDGVKL